MSFVLCPFLFSYILFCFRLSCLYPLCSFEMQEEIALYIIMCFTLQRILLSLFFYSFQHFFKISLPILKRSLTFAAVKQLAMTYQITSAQQRNFDFFAFFSALYLVVSDILLTHTHTHRRYQRLIILFFFHSTRARSVV